MEYKNPIWPDCYFELDYNKNGIAVIKGSTNLRVSNPKDLEQYVIPIQKKLEYCPSDMTGIQEAKMIDMFKESFEIFAKNTIKNYYVFKGHEMRIVDFTRKYKSAHETVRFND